MSRSALAVELAYSLAAVAVAAASAAWLYRTLSASDAPPRVAPSVTNLIGNTPIVRLNELSRITGCDIYAKLELANPGGSAKDRIALAIVEHAESTGQLRPGKPDCVFEGTSGSTGISLALVCRAKGYEAHIVVPNDTSRDKVDLLVKLGAHVHEVLPASIADAGHYVNTARRLAAETNAAGDRRAVFANQFEDEQNWLAHFRTTGPEIVAQMRALGRPLDCFVHGAGTGGTISGVARYLKDECRMPTKIVLADVPGSGLYNKIHFGVMFNATEREGTRRRHQVDTIVEGIGLNRITANFAMGYKHIDGALRVGDVDSRYMASFLVDHEGLFVGSSSAVNGVAVFRQAVSMGPGHTLLTILCDSGTRHISKFWKQELDPDCAIAQEIQELS